VLLSNRLNCAQPPAKATIFNFDKIISDSRDFVKTNITPSITPAKSAWSVPTFHAAIA